MSPPRLLLPYCEGAQQGPVKGVRWGPADKTRWGNVTGDLDWSLASASYGCGIIASARRVRIFGRPTHFDKMKSITHINEDIYITTVVQYKSGQI